MRRRDFLITIPAGMTAFSAPRVLLAQKATSITFVPHADLASLDPVWTTADITRNFSLAVYDTLYGYDAQFKAQPQMVEGHTTEDDGKEWDPDIARRAEIPRRRAGPGARLRRDDQALGQALPDGSGADGPHRRALRRVRQGDPLSPEKAVPAAARGAGRALLLDHAGAAGQDRRLRAGQGGDRLRAVQIRRVRAHTRPARRLREKPGLRPARQRQTELQRRPQSGPYRPRRLEFRAGSFHRLGSARARRGRLVGEPDDRPRPATQAQQGSGHHGQGPHRRDRLPALQPAVPAFRQCRRCAASCSRR